MKKKTLKMVSNLFSFKTIKDEYDNEYVVFKRSPINHIDDIVDKTQFEAIENHIHLFDKVKQRDVEELSSIGKNIGKALLYTLNAFYPQKRFVVYVTITVGDSMIIRFHQKWDGEPLYYEDIESLRSRDEVIFEFTTS